MFVADELGFDDFAYFAWDARGHGYSPGERGDSPSIGTSVADVDDFIRHIQNEYGIKPENICVIAQVWCGDCLLLGCTITRRKSVAPYWLHLRSKSNSMFRLPVPV